MAGAFDSQPLSSAPFFSLCDSPSAFHLLVFIYCSKNSPQAGMRLRPIINNLEYGKVANINTE